MTHFLTGSQTICICCPLLTIRSDFSIGFTFQTPRLCQQFIQPPEASFVPTSKNYCSYCCSQLWGMIIMALKTHQPTSVLPYVGARSAFQFSTLLMACSAHTAAKYSAVLSGVFWHIVCVERTKL